MAYNLIAYGKTKQPRGWLKATKEGQRVMGKKLQAIANSSPLIAANFDLTNPFSYNLTNVERYIKNPATDFSSKAVSNAVIHNFVAQDMADLQRHKREHPDGGDL